MRVIPPGSPAFLATPSVVSPRVVETAFAAVPAATENDLGITESATKQRLLVEPRARVASDSRERRPSDRSATPRTSAHAIADAKVGNPMLLFR